MALCRSVIVNRLRRKDQLYAEANMSLCVSYKTAHFDCLIVDCISNQGILACTKCYPLSHIIPLPGLEPKETMAMLYVLLHQPQYRQTIPNFLKWNLPTIPPLSLLTQKNCYL